MSNVNIRRAVENIRGTTNVYTPIVEIVVNAIQAIEATGRKDGAVTIQIDRSPQSSFEDQKPEVVGFTITDNGEGFTDENREAFDTLYTERKVAEGGKGFGRFTCLKYFSDVAIESDFLKANVEE
jgi:signal transduction histidine kinase